ncbi:hypothetical protein ACFXTH_010546 [Malus domestica]
MDACIGVKLHISTLKSAQSVLALSDYSCPWSKAEFPNMDQFQLVSSESDSSYFRHQTIIKILRIRVGGVPVSMNMLPFETLPEELKGTLIPCGLTKYGVLSSLVTKGVETTPSPNLALWKEEWEDRAALMERMEKADEDSILRRLDYYVPYVFKPKEEKKLFADTEVQLLLP